MRTRRRRTSSNRPSTGSSRSSCPAAIAYSRRAGNESTDARRHRRRDDCRCLIAHARPVPSRPAAVVGDGGDDPQPVRDAGRPGVAARAVRGAVREPLRREEGAGLPDRREPAGGERGLDPLPRRESARTSSRSSRTPRSASSTRSDAASGAGRSAGAVVLRTASPTAATSSSATSRTGGSDPMRDVIVVGAGGGGPVVAKELAARGLDVLVLEAGAGLRRQRAGLDALRDRGEQSGDRRVPLRPRRPHAAAVGARAAAELLPLAGGRRRRDDAALLRQLAARDARGLLGLHRAPTRPPTTARTRSRSPTAS